MIFKLLIDFGLVILVWMTQLVVYPGFTYFSEKDFAIWHPKYTTAISIIVMPLMLGQVFLHTYDLTQEFTWLRTLAFSLVLLTWVNTFFFAVPLHNQIAAEQDMIAAAKKLVSVNWYRTVLWSAVFLLTMYDYLRT